MHRLGSHAPELQVAYATDGVKACAQLRAVLVHCQPRPRRAALALRPLHHKVCTTRSLICITTQVNLWGSKSQQALRAGSAEPKALTCGARLGAGARTAIAAAAACCHQQCSLQLYSCSRCSTREIGGRLGLQQGSQRNVMVHAITACPATPSLCYCRLSITC